MRHRTAGHVSLRVSPSAFRAFAAELPGLLRAAGEHCEVRGSRAQGFPGDPGKFRNAIYEPMASMEAALDFFCILALAALPN